MGTVRITVEVGGPSGERFEPVDVTVDTGATFSQIPGDLLRRLGVPVQRILESELADGRLETVQAGEAVIRLEGQQITTPVIFAGEDEPNLLGVVALETALLAVDPVRRRLYPTRVLRYGKPLRASVRL